MTRHHTDARAHAGKLTGRTVLCCLLAFFGIVIAMNAVLIRAATTSFGGIETPNAYKAGLAFNREIAAARAQEARHWAVGAHLLPVSAGKAMLSVTVRDRQGKPPSGTKLVARLAHPADIRRDKLLLAREFAEGVFTAAIDAAPGQWDLTIDVMRGDERLFRSKNRVIMR